MSRPPAGPWAGLQLVKYEGAGNDFLVLFDEDGAIGLGGDEVRALCDRHHGIGADGLLRVLAGPPGSDVRMDLRNADGSPAEMSGNGIRCLAHAVVSRGLVPGPVVVVATDAGIRRVELRPVADGVGGEGTVAMGQVSLGDEVDPTSLVDVPGPAGPEVLARRVDAGNPHLVVVVPQVDPTWVDGWARAVDAATPGGTNVELVRVDGPGAMTLSVWERGVGATLACGTGTTAAAAAAEAWGLVDLPVRVANPGGVLWVERRDGELVLGGPSRRVAEIRVDARSLAGAGTRPGGDGSGGGPPAGAGIVTPAERAQGTA